MYVNKGPPHYHYVPPPEPPPKKSKPDVLGIIGKVLSFVVLIALALVLFYDYAKTDPEIRLPKESPSATPYHAPPPYTFGEDALTAAGRGQFKGKAPDSSTTIYVKRVTPSPEPTLSGRERLEALMGNSGTDSVNQDEEPSLSELISKILEERENEDDGETVHYVASRSSDKFHRLWCSYVDNIKSSNKVYYSSRQAAINAGKEPCSRCNP